MKLLFFLGTCSTVVILGQGIFIIIILLLTCAENVCKRANLLSDIHVILIIVRCI